LDEVFAPFFKADDSRHELGYVGLGLSIARRSVERFEGRLWAESDGPGKGCRLRFSLPLWIA
jgi:signal transduction histidine kinase